MRCYSAGISLAVLWLACGHECVAADLNKIDRTIAKEPVYQSKAPRYCLLVFGPEAKTRIWLVLDGDLVYVDRNGNGDLTDSGERVPMPALHESKHPLFQELRDVELGDIKEGELVHTDLGLEQVRVRRNAQPDTREQREFLHRTKDIPEGFMFYVRVSVDLSWPSGPRDRSAAKVRQVAYEDRHGVLTFATSRKDGRSSTSTAPYPWGCSLGRR